jgi:fibronectin-binding autotransporter adhesin
MRILSRPPEQPKSALPKRRTSLFLKPVKPRQLLFLPALILVTTSSLGADRYWEGATNNWITPTNWSDDASGAGPDGIPGTGDDIYFSVSGLTTTQTVNLNSSPTIGSLNFLATAGATTLQGGGTNRTLTLGGGIHVASGAGAVNVGSTSGGQNVALVLTDSQSFTNNSTNLLRIQNAVSLSSADNEILTVGGSGNTTFGTNAGISNGSGGGVMGVTKTGSGTLTTVASSYTGVTTISGGTLATASMTLGGNASGVGASGADSANLVLDGGTFHWTGGSAFGTDRGFTLTANGGTLRNDNAGTAILLRFGGVVTGSGDLTKVGSGLIALSGANDFTGKVLVNEGYLSARRPAALGTTGTVDNGTEVALGARLELDPGNTGGVSGSQTWNELLTLKGGTLHNVSNTGSNTNSWAGGIILTANSFLSAVSNTTLIVNSVISGSNVGFTKVGAGNVTLSGANTFTGVVTVSEGKLTLSSFTAGGVAGSLGQSNGASNFLVLDGGTLGFTQNVGTDRGFTLADGKTSTIENTGAANNFRFSGIVTGGGNLNKTGNGILAFTSTANDFTGVINVLAGTLSVRRGTGTGGNSTLGKSTGISDGTVIHEGATLQFDPGNTTEGSGTNISMAEHLTLNGGALRSQTRDNTATGAVVLTASSHLTAASGATLRISASTAITETAGSYGITKSDAGTVVIASTGNTYTGTTTVTEGTLLVTGNINTSKALTINGGTFSAGAANIIKDDALVTLGGGILKMNGFSDALGVLAVTGAAELALAGGNSIVSFANSGGQAWTSAALSITGWSGLAEGSGVERILFDAAGLSPEQIAAVTFLDPLGFAPGSYSAKFVGNELVPDVLIPEPSALLLGAGGLAGFAFRRRRI